MRKVRREVIGEGVEMDFGKVEYLDHLNGIREWKT